MTARYWQRPNDDLVMTATSQPDPGWAEVKVVPIDTPADRNALIMRGWAAAADSLDRAPDGQFSKAAESLRTIAKVAMLS